MVILIYDGQIWSTSTAEESAPPRQGQAQQKRAYKKLAFLSGPVWSLQILAQQTTSLPNDAQLLVAVCKTLVLNCSATGKQIIISKVKDLNKGFGTQRIRGSYPVDTRSRLPPNPSGG
jgi:hypothetical protein